MRQFYLPAAVILGLSSLASRILGVVRDRLLTATFGATRESAGIISELDLYYAAFRLPDFVYNLLILGTVSSVFIPIFSGLISRDRKEAWKIANSVTNLVFVVMSGLCFVLWVFAPYIMKYFAYGFDAASLERTVELTRLMLLSPLLFGLAAVATSVLNSFKRFVAISLSPVMYNIGIIAGIIWLQPLFGIEGVTYGVIIGAALYLAVLLPSLFAVGYRPRLVMDLSHPRMKKMGAMAIPRFLSLSASQISLIINTSIASSFIVGSVTILNLAINLQSLPVGVIGLSVALATFSTLAEIASNGKLDHFADRIASTTKMILFLIIPATAGMIQLRAELVRLLLGSGAFSWRDTVITADTTGYLAIGLFALALLPLFSRAFYALEDTKTPLYITIGTVVLNVILAVLFGIYMNMQVQGLALAMSLANIVNISFLYFYLNEKLENRLNQSDLLSSVLKIVFATAVMMAFVQLTKWHIGSMVDMETFVGVAIKVLSATAVGFASFIATAHLLGCQEVGEVLKKFRR